MREALEMDPRMEALVSGLLDGELTHEQKSELLGRLQQDSELARTVALLWRESAALQTMLGAAQSLAFTEKVLSHARYTVDSPGFCAKVEHQVLAEAPRISGRSYWRVVLATAACVTIVAGLWWFNQRPAGLGLRVAEIQRSEVGGQRSEVRVSGTHVQRSGGRDIPAVVGLELRQGDRVVVESGGKAALKYDGEETRIELHAVAARSQPEHGAAAGTLTPGPSPIGRGEGPPTTIATFGAEKGVKRVNLAAGTLVCTAAPQKVPLEIKTPNAVARVVGTQFTLEADAEATRIEVVAGLVRLTRSQDNASVDVPAGHQAVASSGADLRIEPTRPRGLLLDLDFENQTLPQGSSGPVVEGPRAANSRFCVTGVLDRDYRLFRVNIRNGSQALLTYREGAVLSFDYWVKKQTGAIDVYFWNDTRSISPDFTVYGPAQEQWTRFAVRLSDFKKEVRDGDIISDLTIQTTPGGNELFVDNIRIEKEEIR